MHLLHSLAFLALGWCSPAKVTTIWSLEQTWYWDSCGYWLWFLPIQVCCIAIRLNSTLNTLPNNYDPIITTGAKFELPAYLTAVTMTVELFRRTIWSFFRLEHEQRQNTLGFRRVHVVPLHFSTGHKHKYNERHWVGWKVLVEIMVVTLIVVAISAFSVISAQRATTHYQLELSHDSQSDL